jgi:hypothetical protein
MRAPFPPSLSILILAPVVVLAGGLTACGSESTTTGVNTPPTASTVRVEITKSGEASPIRASVRRHLPVAADFAAGIGEAAPDRLEYFLTSLQLCADVTTNGTGFSGTEGCVEVYGNQTVDYNSYGYTEARGDNVPGNYFDLMDPATLTALNQSVPVEAGTYQWALANWNKPVRVQAMIPLSGGGSLFTRDGDRVLPNGFAFTQTTADLTSGPAELAITDLNNGGTWFRLQRPVVIPENGGSYTLSLVFNPDRLIKASASGASNASIQDTSTVVRGIYVPLLDLTPVLHQTADAVRKESYVLTGADQFSIRLELYSVDSDPEHAIVGADVKTLYTAGTTLNLMHPMKISFLATADDGSTTFEIWDHSPMIEGFTRSAVGGTVTLDCQAAFFSTDACGGATTVTLAYAAPEVTTID